MWLRVKRLIIAVAVLLLIQAYQPARTNLPVDPKREIHYGLQADVHVAATLARSCNDCHSNRTNWPWYSRLAPASWLVVSDVNRGRKALSFSEWNTYGAKEQREHLEEICKEVTEGEMPGFLYTLIHRDAKLSKTDVAAVCSWTQTAPQTSVAEQR